MGKPNKTKNSALKKNIVLLTGIAKTLIGGFEFFSASHCF